MPTINQLIRKPKKKSNGEDRISCASNCPQRRGICTRVMTVTPKSLIQL